MNESCVPWYFPAPDDQNFICDPWEAVQFLKFMNKVPDTNCSHCLPGKLIYIRYQVRVRV